jgi:hypothetical protein
MSSYQLQNTDDFPFEAGDTLHYVLTYVNGGNITADEVMVSFPTTALLQPIGQGEFFMDSLSVSDSSLVPLMLRLVQDNPEDAAIEYAPQVSWTSNGKSYSRKYRILVETESMGTGVAPSSPTIPKHGFTLYGNYPNPFNTTTIIRYQLYKQMPVKLSIYDILGRQVATLVDAVQPAGNYQIVWDGKNTDGREVASGIYFCQFQAKQVVENRKLVLLR